MDLPRSTILFASAQASAHFALACLEPYHGHLRAKSSFVDPRGNVMHWHDFGDLEGPGWAANALGGAALLWRWGAYTGDTALQTAAVGLVDHVLEDGFIETESGFVWPYFDLAQQRFCLNYSHNNHWLCPGSLAKIGTQMLELADLFPADPRAARLRQAALELAGWLREHTPRLPNGWLPRRITLDGTAYPQSPTGGPDPIFDHSADGLYLLELYAALESRGLGDYRREATDLGEVFVARGGLWGSINHDTYDDHESVAYTVAYRVLTRAAAVLDRPDWRTFAAETALPALARFTMRENRQGVATRGLLWMEESWDTAYLWESAEAAQAYLEHWSAAGDAQALEAALGILSAIAGHHTGPLGFLTEGVDWNNHVSRRHHVREALFGDINYTEPLLNHLHFLGPSLFYFEQAGIHPPAGVDTTAALHLVQTLNAASQAPLAGAGGARYYLRFYYPALETDARLEQALDFTARSGADGVLLFEASYDMDPALLSLDTLRARFARIKAILPRFRASVPEVHINMMITLGHVDAGSARPDHFPFQYLVDEHGQVSRSTACPLDLDFLEHAAVAYRLAAECDVDAIWVDDDTRLVLHDLPGMPCFCPRHLAVFSARSGHHWTREELAAALARDPDQPDTRRLRDAWFDLQEETLLELARVIERAVHGAAPATRIGLMTIGTAFHAAEGRQTDRLLRVLAADTQPLIRPGSGYWSDWQPASVIEKSEDCARQISFLGADVQAFSEVENHPYSPHLKSDRLLALELALDVLAGMPDLSLNLLTSMGGSGPLEPEGSDYAGVLSAQRAFLNALAREWSGRVRRGVGLTCSESSPRRARLPKPDLRGWIESRPWEPLLARLGFPIGRPDQGPHWIAGQVGWSLSAGDWAQHLREGAVLDPVAAQALLASGAGQSFGLTGVRQMITAVNEQLTDDPLNAARAGQILPAYNHLPIDQLYTWEFTPGAGRILSRWLDVDGQDRGSALALLERDNGQRAVLLPYELHAPAAVLVNVAHREQWAAALEWVQQAPLPVRIVHGANLYPQVFYRPEDESWLVAVANLSADDVTGARLRLSFPPRQIEWLAPDGAWQPVAAGTGPDLSIAVSAFSLAAWRIQTT